MVETARQIAIRRAAQALDRSSAFPLIFPDFRGPALTIRPPGGYREDCPLSREPDFFG
jgi:hypothetical protein